MLLSLDLCPTCSPCVVAPKQLELQLPLVAAHSKAVAEDLSVVAGHFDVADWVAFVAAAVEPVAAAFVGAEGFVLAVTFLFSSRC